MTNLIKTFGMTAMTVGSCCEFHHQVLDHITAATPEALHIEDLVPSYKAKLANLQSVVNRKKAFAATADLQVNDQLRDGGIGVVNAVVNAFKNSPVEANRNAAMLLAPELAAYAGISRHEYTKQTAEVRGMLAVLTSPKFAAAVSQLNLDGEVQVIATSNDAFDAAMKDKQQEKAQQMKQSDLESRQLMEELNLIYEQIVQRVNAYSIVQPTETINTFVDCVNGTVGMFCDVVDGTTSNGTVEDVPTTDGGTDTTPDTGGTDSGDSGEDSGDDSGTTPPDTGGSDDDEEVVG